MNVICESSHLDWITLKVITDACDILMKIIFEGWLY